MRNLNLASTLVAIVAATNLSLPAYAQSDAAAGQSLAGVWLRASATRGFPMSQWSPMELPFTAAGRAQFDANIPGKGPRETLPARGNFDIRARHKRLGGGFGFVLPVTARAGCTCEALAGSLFI